MALGPACCFDEPGGEVTDVADDARRARGRLAGLMDGHLTTQLLHVAAKLGVADVLAAGPLSGAAVAHAVGVDADAMTRILRGLAVDDSSSSSRSCRNGQPTSPRRSEWTCT